MKVSFTFLLALTTCLICKGQSIFSTLHLNEERDVRSGIPKVISETRIFYNSNSTERKKELTEFDQLGLPISKKFVDENGITTSMVTYKYDSIKRVILESNLSEFVVRFPTNRVRTIYQYTESKTPIRIQYLNSSNDVLTDVFLKNDSLGLPIELQLFEPLGNLIGFEIASYIRSENKAIVSVGNNQGRILNTDTMKISFKDAYKFHDPDISYNEKGDVIFAQSRWPDGTLHFMEYEYTYDEMGNWTDQKAFEVTSKSRAKKNRKLKSHFKREMQYWTK